MGPGVAIQLDGAAEPALAVAEQVEVHERAGEPTRYRLRYPLSVLDGDFAPLRDARLHRGSEVSVLIADPELECLVRGPLTGQQIHFQNGISDSWVDMSGGDRSLLMDGEARAEVWSGKASAAVAAIARRHGFAEDVVDTATEHDESGSVLVQRDSDLRFVRRIARRYGFLFWVTCDTRGSATAHFRRPNLDRGAAARLTLNHRSANLESFDLEWDLERPGAAVADQISLPDKDAIDGGAASSPLTGLAGVAYGDLAAPGRTVRVVAPAVDGGDLRARAEAAVIEASWFVRARCRTSVRALGKAIHPTDIVVVEGLGRRHSGRYLVGAVHHRVDAAGHAMDIELYRNAWEE